MWRLKPSSDQKSWLKIQTKVAKKQESETDLEEGHSRMALNKIIIFEILRNAYFSIFTLKRAKLFTNESVLTYFLYLRVVSGIYARAVG